MAESPPKLYKALCAALAELTVVEPRQTANAGSYSYRYADIADIVSLTRPVLARHGLVALTPVGAYEAGLACTVTLLHDSGERLDFEPLPFPHGRDAQATGSMITYHRRYALLAALGMATGDDDDGAGAQPVDEVEGVARARFTSPAADEVVDVVIAAKKERDRITAILNEIPADATVEVDGRTVKARQAAKVDYLETFALTNPARLPADKVDDALEWAKGRLALHTAGIELDKDSALKGIRIYEQRLDEAGWTTYTAWLTETFSETELDAMDAGDLEQVWRYLQELTTGGVANDGRLELPA